MRIYSIVREVILRADKVLLSLCCASTLFGIILIASATQYTDSFKNVIVQSVALIIGIVCYFLFSCLNIERVSEKWKWILAFNILFILSLTVFGTEVGGNKNWIRFSWFPIGIQPAEVVKITFIILLALQLSVLQEHGINRISSVIQLCAHIGLMCILLITISGDAGMTLVYCFIFAAMTYCAGLKLRWFAAAFALIGTCGFLIWPKIPPYMKMRILVIFDHSLDPLDIGWQQSRSLLAIGSGQFSGQGLFQGTQTQSLYESSLPDRHTDFIFSVAGEELGMLGCLLILLLLSAVILRCIFASLSARSPQTALVGVGIAAMLLFQVMINIGMCLFLMPVVGLTLPFFSYGGSSIVTTFIAMGLVSEIQVRSTPSWLKN